MAMNQSHSCNFLCLIQGMMNNYQYVLPYYTNLTLLLRLSFYCVYFIFRYQVLVIIDARPRELGLPTEAYIAVEEVHDVSILYIELTYHLNLIVEYFLLKYLCLREYAIEIFRIILKHQSIYK